LFLFIQTENCSHTTDLQSELEHKEGLLVERPEVTMRTLGRHFPTNNRQCSIKDWHPFLLSRAACKPCSNSTVHCSTTQSNKMACLKEYFQIYNIDSKEHSTTW